MWMHQFFTILNATLPVCGVCWVVCRARQQGTRAERWGGLTCNNTGDFSHEAFHSPDGDTFGLILDESNNLLNLQKRTRKKGQLKQTERHRSRTPRPACSSLMMAPHFCLFDGTFSSSQLLFIWFEWDSCSLWRRLRCPNNATINSL